MRQIVATDAPKSRQPAAEPPRPRHRGFDGWLMAVRAFPFLAAGMLAVSLATV